MTTKETAAMKALVAACEDASRVLRSAAANVDWPREARAEIHRDDCWRLAERLEAAVDRAKGGAA